jgi:predicted DNA-binding protein
MRKKMAGRPAKSTTQITLRVPDEWLPRADALAKKLSRPGLPTTRVDALRAAIATGFEALEKP